MYKIQTEENLIYDSTDKYHYPVSGPVLNLELGEAGNLDLTLLPGHPMRRAMEEMHTIMTVYQDEDILFDGRVLQAEEDIFGQVRVTVEGALTFLLDSEMEPGTYTETITEFFARCINAHNRQVEPEKQFSIGNVNHEEAEVKEEFKLEGYNQTRQVLANLLVGKHGGFLSVRYENGQRYLDYIQHYTKTNNQQIKIGYNVLDRTKRINGENLFTILRPLGKDGLTIEKASSENLMPSSEVTSGKYLGQANGSVVESDSDYAYLNSYIPVAAGQTYLFGPGDMTITYFDADHLGLETVTPSGNSVTIPDGVSYVKLSYNKAYDSKLTFLQSGGTNVLTGTTKEGCILNEDGTEYASPGWNYKQSYISVTPGSKYIAFPGSAVVIFYDSQQHAISAFQPDDDLGCDVFTVPANTASMRVCYESRFESSMKVFPFTDGQNLATRASGSSGKLVFHAVETEITDEDWCYNPDYISVESDAYYTGGPSPVKISFYDANKQFIASEEGNRSGMTMHYVKSPVGAAFARVSFLAEYESEQQLQKGKALILTKLDPGTKTILMPERIAKYGQIIHTESFSDITDPQQLYNAAIAFVQLHHSRLPSSLDVNIVDFHLLNPDIQMFELGDVYDNIEGFEDEVMTIGSLTKDLENPANDSLTLKNLAELMGSDAGSSTGSLSSKYAASSSGGYGGSGNTSATEEEQQIPDEVLIQALKSIGIEAPVIRLLATERDGIKAAIDLIARQADGNESRIALTGQTAKIMTGKIDESLKKFFGSAYQQMADEITLANGVFSIDSNNVLHINDGSGLIINQNGSQFGVYNEGNLTAGVIAETLTNQDLGTKTALRLLGDNIDLTGNTFINGILDVSKYVQSGDFVIREGTKFGLSSGTISVGDAIGDAFVSVSKSQSGDDITLIFKSADGTSTPITFNKAATGSVRLNGGGSNMFTAEYYTATAGSQTVVAKMDGHVYFSPSSDYTRATDVYVGMTAAGSGSVAQLDLSGYWDTAYASGQNSKIPKRAVATVDTVIGESLSTGTVAITLNDNSVETISGVNISTGAAYDAGYNQAKSDAIAVNALTDWDATINGTLYRQVGTDRYMEVGSGTWRLGGSTMTAYYWPATE